LKHETKLSQEKAGNARLPERVKLPSPAQLAQIAAGFGIDTSPERAIAAAVSLYLRAVFFANEHDNDSLEDLAEACGDVETRQRLFYAKAEKAIDAQWADVLELDPREDDDAARRFLAQRGLALKKPRSVLDNFRRYWEQRPSGAFDTWQRSADSIITDWKRLKNGRTIYCIPKILLEKLAKFAKLRRKESKRKAWRSRQRKSCV